MSDDPIVRRLRELFVDPVPQTGMLGTPLNMEPTGIDPAALMTGKAIEDPDRGALIAATIGEMAVAHDEDEARAKACGFALDEIDGLAAIAGTDRRAAFEACEQVLHEFEPPDFTRLGIGRPRAFPRVRSAVGFVLLGIPGSLAYAAGRLQLAKDRCLSNALGTPGRAPENRDEL